MNQLVRENHVSAGSLTAIGSVEKVEVGFFVGNGRCLTISSGGPLADKQGKGCGGHLMPRCIIDLTFEVVLHAYDKIDLGRKLDPASKLRYSH